MRSRRSLWLHIGAEKTGSTSLQRFLWDHRARLREAGFLYPESPCPSDDGKHSLLAAAFLAPRKRDFVPEARRGVGPAALQQALAEEVARADAPRAILSSEHLHSRLNEPRRLRALVSMLRSVGFERIRLVVYVRRQDQLLEAAYRSAVQSGARPSPASMIREVKRGRGWWSYADYRSLLERWTEAVDPADVIVRRYERERLLGRSVEVDFAAAVGIEGAATWPRGAEWNRARPAEVTGYLRHLNATGGARLSPDDSAREALIDALEGLPGLGGHHVFDPAQRAALRAAFAESNAAVAARFLPGQGPLFSGFDDGAPAVRVDAARFAEITRMLLEAQAGR